MAEAQVAQAEAEEAKARAAVQRASSTPSPEDWRSELPRPRPKEKNASGIARQKTGCGDRTKLPRRLPLASSAPLRASNLWEGAAVTALERR